MNSRLAHHALNPSYLSLWHHQDAWLRHHLGVVSGLSGTAHLFLALIAHKQPPRHRSSPASLLVSALWAFLGLALAARCLVPPLQTLLREVSIGK